MRRTAIFLAFFLRSENLSACFSVSRSKVVLYVGRLCAEGPEKIIILKSLHPVTQPIEEGIVGSVTHQRILGFFDAISMFEG